VLLQALWDSQHTWAGEQMYDLAISLRGFYLKVGGSSQCQGVGSSQDEVASSTQPFGAI
jgi:hypothetical protein